MRWIPPALAALLVCAGCDSLYTSLWRDAGRPATEDAGEVGEGDSGSRADGGGPDGKDAGDGGDGLSADGGDGGSRADGGPADGGDGGRSSFAGDGGPFSFWSLEPPLNPIYLAVHGRSANDVYVAGSQGRLVHWDGQRWTVLLDDLLYGTLEAVWAAPGGELFVAGSDYLGACTRRCDAGAPAFQFQPTNGIDRFSGLCGGGPGNVVYAVGRDRATLTGVLYRFSGSSWVAMGGAPGEDYSSCWVAPTGAVFIAGKENVMRADDAGFTVEPVMPFSQMRWLTLFSADGQLSVGGDSKAIAVRGSDGGWTVALPPRLTGVGAFRAIGGAWPEELFAVGDEARGFQRARFTPDAGWVFDTDLPVRMNVFGMWAADENRYFLVGKLLSTPNGGVLLGKR